MTVSWFDKADLLKAVTGKLSKAKVVLDIGCGIMPQMLIRPLVQICCEPFMQYIQVLQEKVKYINDRSFVILNVPWSEVVNIFPPKSVDTIFLIDVIEHLEKEEAQKLLKRTENIARKQIVIFTPLGFVPQSHSDGKDAWGLDGGAWQEHKSGWLPEDFDESWEICACRVFHTADNLGNEYEDPFGAMWGIKNVIDISRIDTITSAKDKFDQLVKLKEMVLNNINR